MHFREYRERGGYDNIKSIRIARNVSDIFYIFRE